MDGRRGGVCQRDGGTGLPSPRGIPKGENLDDPAFITLRIGEEVGEGEGDRGDLRGCSPVNHVRGTAGGKADLGQSVELTEGAGEGVSVAAHQIQRSGGDEKSQAEIAILEEGGGIAGGVGTELGFGADAFDGDGLTEVQRHS